MGNIGWHDTYMRHGHCIQASLLLLILKDGPLKYGIILCCHFVTLSFVEFLVQTQ